MPLPEPFRAGVWDVDLPEFGPHPAVIISINLLNGRLGHVAVMPVTGTPGPDQTHVVRTQDAGLTRSEESYGDVTALQPVARTRLLRRRGLLTRAEMDRVDGQLTTYLGG